ncbi:sodium:proton antiporter NhaD [Desulfobacula sp.]|uniref:sodium:proton antiporter NhaD n=1 Tax=Desulfobacula sp. TaxID=2593537 RepID=UPI00260174F5|nr:sodium:proton antiporter NhaD [Desulfobacula sp.]
MAGSVYGYLGIFVFLVAYSLVPLENFIHLRKSKPVMLAAGLIWIFVALAYKGSGDLHTAHDAIKRCLLEYAELLLFLLSAMTYINSLEERNVFQMIRAFLIGKGFSLRGVFWSTGALAFFISPVADNLTTALLMGSIVMAVGGDDRKFIALSCINIVVAANAGGAFSPFGDITTLMVWQKGKVDFFEFFALFLPAMANWLVPAIIMNFAIIRNKKPTPVIEDVRMKYGAKMMMILFLLTITTAVCFHNFLNLPPAAGMMFGLACLGIFSHHVKLKEGREHRYDYVLGARKLGKSHHPLHPFLGKTFERIGQLLEDSSLPAFMIDREHKITRWNKAMEDLTGIKATACMGTRDQWKPFYHKKRPALCDIVIDRTPDALIGKFYHGKYQTNDLIKSSFDVSDFFPSISDTGKWLLFTAAPITDKNGHIQGAVEVIEDVSELHKKARQFDIMERVSRAEWDTLLFFYGVILCVGGLAQFGYLDLISTSMYATLGFTLANVIIGAISAIVDNIPVMFSVLTMDPGMPLNQWLLVTLTTGTGGSLLAIGSAAGVALMGTARGTYTFGVHLKWMPVIACGYLASIFCHLLIS